MTIVKTYKGGGSAQRASTAKAPAETYQEAATRIQQDLWNKIKNEYGENRLNELPTFGEISVYDQVYDNLYPQLRKATVRGVSSWQFYDGGEQKELDTARNRINSALNDPVQYAKNQLAGVYKGYGELSYYGKQNDDATEKIAKNYIPYLITKGVSTKDINNLFQTNAQSGFNEAVEKNKPSGVEKFLTTVLPLAVGSILAPGLGSALGSSILGSAAASATVTGLTTGDLEKALAAGLIAGGASYVGDLITAPDAGVPATPPDVGGAVSPPVSAGSVPTGIDIDRQINVVSGVDPYISASDLYADLASVQPSTSTVLPSPVGTDIYADMASAAPAVAQVAALPIEQIIAPPAAPPVGGADLYQDLANVGITPMLPSPTPGVTGEGAFLGENVPSGVPAWDAAAIKAGLPLTPPTSVVPESPADLYADLAEVNSPADYVEVVDRSIPFEDVPDKPLSDALLDLAKATGEYAMANPLTTTAFLSGVSALTDKAPEEAKTTTETPRKVYTYGAAAPIRRTGLEEIRSAAAGIYGPETPVAPRQQMYQPPAFEYTPAPLLRGQAGGGEKYGLGSLSQEVSYRPIGTPQTFDISNLTPEQIIRLQDVINLRRQFEGG